MSINLHAKAGDIEINLFQTPSVISWMICTDERGQMDEWEGRDAKRALRAYLYWAHSTLKFESADEIEDWKRHEKYIHSFLKRDDLKVWCI
jgi:hypothetical protein